MIVATHYSVAQDSLVRYSELRFDSDFEKQTFQKYFKQQNQDVALHLLLAVTVEGPNKLSAADSRINDVVTKLQQAGVTTKKPEKRVKIVYDQIHSAFLIKYEMVNRFSEVFTSGNYNCVTATALYAIIFEKLNIPYSIQEKPTHVFLVAFPGQQNILVETTSPLFGYLTFDARYMESFVSNLKNSKLIGSAEATSQSTEVLFNKYYFGTEDINLRKLIGIHYMNDALYRNDNKDVLGAFRQCEKAYMFYPSQRCAFLLTSFAAEILEKQKLRPEERAWFIAKASRYKTQGITNDMVKGEFARLNQDVWLKQNNRTLYDSCTNIILENCLSDAELKNEIRYFQYYEIGRANYNQGRYSPAKYFFAKAFEIQPNNAELGATFLSTLMMSLRNKTEESGILDTVLVYKKRFPTLEQNNNFNSLLANAYLAAITNEVNKGNVKTAEEYRHVFESMLGENNGLLIDNNTAGRAYSELCTYYFKKGQKEKARSLLKKGLEISPDSYELRIRKQMIN